MVTLTSYRLYAVLFPWKAGQLRVSVASVWSLIAWLLAITLAVIPRIEYLEDYFVKSVWLSTNQSYSQYYQYGSVRKPVLLQFIVHGSILTGRTNSSTLHQVCDRFWKLNTTWGK